MTDFDLDRLGDVWRQQPDPAEMERLQKSAAAVARRAQITQVTDIVAAIAVAAVVIFLVASNPKPGTMVIGSAAILILLFSNIRLRRVRRIELEQLTGGTEEMLDQSIGRVETSLRHLRVSIIGFPLTLLVGAVVPVVLAVTTFFSRRLRAYSQFVQERLAALTTILEETVAGIRIVKSFQLEGMQRERMGAGIDAVRRMGNRIVGAQAAMNGLVEVVAGLVIGVVVLYAGWRNLSAGDTPGQFFAFIAALLMASDPLRRLSRLQLQLTAAAVGADTVRAIGALRPDVAFIGTNGVSAGFGLSTPDPDEAAVKRAIVAAARRVVVVADADKLGAELLVGFASFPVVLFLRGA